MPPASPPASSHLFTPLPTPSHLILLPVHYHNTPLHLPRTHPITLPLPDGASLELLLQPLPLGFHRRLHQHQILPPQPPTKIARDSQGKPLRDGNNQALTLRDDHDPAYRQQLDQYHQRLAVLMIAEALQSDPNLRFDTPKPATDDWTTYADALHRELEQAGWTDGLLLHLCSLIARTSRLLDDDLHEAGRNFSNTPRKETS